MMWDKALNRLALMELKSMGHFKRRKRQLEVYEWLLDSPFAQRTSRRDELCLVTQKTASLETLLEKVWPDWRAVLNEMERRGFEPTPKGYAAYQGALKKPHALFQPPQRLHHKSAMGVRAKHSKVQRGAGPKDGSMAKVLTQDFTLRMRVNRGLELYRDGQVLPTDPIQQLLGEIILPERAFLDGLKLGGILPRAIITVENLGPYVDLPRMEGCMMVYVPGWDQSGLKCLLPQLQSTPLLHFGDLDPNGYRIFTHLCQFHGNATLFTPPFWSEYLQSHGQEKAWPDGLDLEEANEAWQRLSKASRWLEQECFILDPRLPEALKAALEDILA